jgi:AraC-like DNA-binding protein
VPSMNISVLDDDSALVSGYLDVTQKVIEKRNDAVVARGVGRPYTGRPHHWMLGALPVCDFSDHGSVHVRPLNRTAPAPAHEFVLGVLLRGRGRLQTGSRDEQLAPGSMVVYPHGDFQLDLVGPYHYMVASLPIAGVGRTAAEFGDGADARQLTSSPALLLSTLLASLPSTVDSLTLGVRAQLSDTVMSLLCAALDETDAGSRSGPPALYSQVLDWIELHLADEDLSPRRVADAHHISPSYLFKLFRAQGNTLGDHITMRRLDRIRADLADPDQGRHAIQTIGARWGFPDPSHLSRAFRGRYGAAPRAYRGSVI